MCKETTGKINILFIIDMFGGVGGTEKHLYDLVRNLNGKCFNCYILTFNFTGDNVEKILNENINVYHVPISRLYSPGSLMRAMLIRGIIKENNIDIVQTFHFKSDTYGVLLSRIFGVKYILSSRRDTGDTKKKRQIFVNKLINSQIDRFITVCDEVGTRLEMDEDVPQKKIITIYNGIDLKSYELPEKVLIKNYRNELKISEEDFVVGMVANFRPEKNYDTFFKAVKRAQKVIKRLKAIAVGGGRLFDHFQKYCNNNGLSEFVIFTGNSDDVKKYISLMDIACMVPGSNEGLSNSILEKMAMGMPLIVTDVGGNKEAVVDGENGIVIPPLDYEKLAEMIIYLHNNPLLRQMMGQKSRERAERLFSLGRMIQYHEELYEEVVKDS